tara:strand:+ start:164 stop:532 length:369 start_codon:yes stop_codon:yes gene_type:complete
MAKKKLSDFEKAYKSARQAGVRYFYWTDPKDGIERKYTTRDINEDPDENVYDDKKIYPDRNKVVGTKVTYENPDYTPQTVNPKEDITPQSVKRKGGKLKKKKKVSKRKQMGGFLLEPPIEQI